MTTGDPPDRAGSEGGEGPREGPPERVRSTPAPPPPPPPAGSAGSAAGGSEEGAAGPVPIRDLMKQMKPEHEPAPEAEADPRWDGLEASFEREGVEWLVRTAGAGAYGTGRLGTARLVAVHFFRESDPGTPVREALVGAGVFPLLSAGELRTLFDRATPIEADR